MYNEVEFENFCDVSQEYKTNILSIQILKEVCGTSQRWCVWAWGGDRGAFPLIVSCVSSHCHLWTVSSSHVFTPGETPTKWRTPAAH